MRTRSSLSVITVVATAALLAACGGQASTGGGGSATGAPSGSSGAGGGAGGTILIANITDFSGVQSPLGIDENAGLQLAVDEVNAAGGIKSMGGAKLEVKKYDTESTPDNGVTQANKAVADGAKVVFGGEISDTVLAATNVTHRAGIPWITPGGTAAQITARGFNDVFQLVGNTDQNAQAYYDVMKFVAGKLNVPTPLNTGLSYSDTTYGNNLHNGFKKANADGTFKLAAEVSYPLSQAADLSSVAARMAAGSPTVLYNEGYPTDGLNLGRLFSEKITTTAKIFLSTGTVDVILKEIGAKGNGMLLSSGPRAAFKGMPDSFTKANDAFNAKNGKGITSSAVNGYQGGKFIAGALEKAGSSGGAAIATALHQVELTHDNGNLNPQDTLSFADNGALKAPPFFFVQIQDAKVVGVFPAAIAAADPIPFR